MKKRLKSTVPEGMQKIPMNFCIAESASRRRYEPDPMLGVSLNRGFASRWEKSRGTSSALLVNNFKVLRKLAGNLY